MFHTKTAALRLYGSVMLCSVLDAGQGQVEKGKGCI